MLHIGTTEMHPSGRPLLRISFAGPHRQGVLKSRDGSVSALRALTGGTLPVGDADIHASGRPPIRVRFAGPHQKSVLQGGNHLIAVTRTMTGETIQLQTDE